MKLLMKVKRYVICGLLVMCAILCVCGLSSCKSSCTHSYRIRKTVSATCTKEGYNKYKCSKCGDKYQEVISAKGHTPGEAPTFDTSQFCTVCETVLASPVNYMSYRGSDLAINHYYRYSNSYVTTQIVSQNLDRYTQSSIKYVSKNGIHRNLDLSIPLQDFFKHSVSSVLPLTTADGKTYSTDSGFKLSFSFATLDKNVDSIHAWDKGLSSEFRNSDTELVKVVGRYQANPSYYNHIYEIVDFSDCYIEIAKKTENGYEPIKTISTKEDWKEVLQQGGTEISNDNSSLFYEAGTYRVLFKYNMTWVADPPSAVYDSKDKKKSNPIYPYGKVNDQYEYFYIAVTGERNNVVLPNSLQPLDGELFCELRGSNLRDNQPFMEGHTTLLFQNDVIFKIGAKVDMTKTNYYYKQYIIKDFSFTLSVYDEVSDTYNEYIVHDLIPSISRDVVYGNEITVDLSEDSMLRDKECKIILTYTFLNETTGETFTSHQDYYCILSW